MKNQSQVLPVHFDLVICDIVDPVEIYFFGLSLTANHYLMSWKNKGRYFQSVPELWKIEKL